VRLSYTGAERAGYLDISSYKISDLILLEIMVVGSLRLKGRHVSEVFWL
jgi:hypothetical protein